MNVNQKAIIYQLVIRYFGNLRLDNVDAGTLEVNGCGKFEDVNDAAMTALKDLGVTHLWLTGCLRQATLTSYDALGLPADDPDIVKGRAGSFYAVRDYFDVSPDYAVDPANRMREFEDLIARAHRHGFKVLIDFIPNHVARSYQSVVRPESSFGDGDDQTQFFLPSNHFFYLVDPPYQALKLTRPDSWNPPDQAFDGAFPREDGSPGHAPKATGDAAWNMTTPAPPKDSWYEAVKLNYGFNYVDQTGHYDPIPRTWLLMDEILAYWQEKGADGFRCDMAHLIPKEAWTYLISRAKAPERNPDAFFMAEAYPYEESRDPIRDFEALREAGFDAAYHDDAYDRLIEVAHGGDPDAYDREMASLPAERRAFAVEYLENHDEKRVAATLDRGGFGSLRANYPFAPLQFLGGNGPVLLLNGQEVGESGGGITGYAGDDGRTSLFDYGSMPEFVKWTSCHRYDSADLSPDQVALRRFFADLLKFCQDPAIRAGGYWGLKYFNRSDRFPDCPDAFYAFARFADGGRRMVVVVSNLSATESAEGRIRLPKELVKRVDLPPQVKVSSALHEPGAKRSVVRMLSETLVSKGFRVSMESQSGRVYVIE